MSKVNEALEHLRAGKARYRIVLVHELVEFPGFYFTRCFSAT